MTADETYIVCATVADLPDPRTAGSEERWCSLCAEPVWMAPASFVHMAKTGHLPLCPECALGLARTSAEPPTIEGPVPPIDGSAP